MPNPLLYPVHVINETPTREVAIQLNADIYNKNECNRAHFQGVQLVAKPSRNGCFGCFLKEKHNFYGRAFTDCVKYIGVSCLAHKREDNRHVIFVERSKNI